jgi:hypothetical protein
MRGVYERSVREECTREFIVYLISPARVGNVKSQSSMSRNLISRINSCWCGLALPCGRIDGFQRIAASAVISVEKSVSAQSTSDSWVATGSFSDIFMPVAT